tara:strand:+ start:264 stop:443 length:180 start_codon:yes stop_codon:yes gene_type:complete
MTEFLITFLVLVIVFLLIGVGMLVNNKPISGSCGGLANIKNGEACEICGQTTLDKCKKI